MSSANLAKLNNVHVDIEKLVHKKTIKRALHGTFSLPRDATSRRDPKWIRVPYLGKTSFGLSKFLKEAGLRPAYYSPNTIQKNICKNLKDPIPLDGRSGVYVLYCSDCPSAYMGRPVGHLNPGLPNTWTTPIRPLVPTL